MLINRRKSVLQTFFFPIPPRKTLKLNYPRYPLALPIATRPPVFMFIRPLDDFRELKGVQTEVLSETFFYEAINTHTKTFAGHYSPSWK